MLFRYPNCSHLPRLTAIRVVTFVTRGWLFVQAERGQPSTSLKMVADQERLYLGNISLARLGKYIWVWLVNKDDWVRKLSLYRFQLLARRLTGPLTFEVESAGACWPEYLSQSPWYPQFSHV